MQKKETSAPLTRKSPSPKKRAPRSVQPPQPPQTPPEQHSPTPQTPEEWRAHWQAQGQPWRTEPEINAQRQEELARHRAITPDVEKGIYPFSRIKLIRADIEWLLATHENGHGPVYWNDEKQRDRKGLDLRGADLRGEDLRHLSLTRLLGGLDWDEWKAPANSRPATEQERRQLEKQLDLAGVQMQGANLFGAQLQGSMLAGARLQKAYLHGAQLQEANLEWGQLQSAHLGAADLQEAALVNADLQEAVLTGADLQEALCINTNLQKADLVIAHLQNTQFLRARLQGADLRKAQLQGTEFEQAQLQGADLREAQLQGVHLEEVQLSDQQGNGPRLADVQWGNTNLAVVDWSQLNTLGDEGEAQQKVNSKDKLKSQAQRLKDYQAAVRANRQLSVALRDQGLNEDAARFAYHAQVLQKAVYWFQMIQDGISFRKRMRALGSWLFSWFLFLLAGYGYKPLRSFLAYVLVIAGFATAYYLLGLHQTSAHSLSWYEAVVISMIAFHGRGFFANTFSPGDPQALVAAIEAFFGLLIEVTFIATLTQRLFSR